MKNIKDVFESLRESNKKALIPFIVVGNKSLKETIEIVQLLETTGADMLELGMPYSDPLSEESIVNNAYHNALLSGIKVKDMISIVKAVTEKVSIPVIVKVYYNVIYCKGIETFVKDLAKAKVSGLIVPDITIDENNELLEACIKNNIDLINFVAPVSNSRAKEIDENSKGFIYTGINNRELSEGNLKYLKEVKNCCNMPLCISIDNFSMDEIDIVKGYCEGIIINSEIAKIMNREKNFSLIKEEISNLVNNIRIKI